MRWTIGEAAIRSGCPASTIRYYERIGLLAPPMRGDNGYRYYDDAALDRLAFVHRARTLGFGLEAVADLLRLADHPNEPCDGVDRLVAAQLSAIRERVAQLRRLEHELLALQTACDGGHEMRECGILEALSRDN
ncbi:MAG: MerR family transcriptional regulator [Salinisphaera sp.]|uniref:MerR family transcriptional regulator n=1 Tax=Salinisphaera sp. TaxID=1914330 RepID=UPI003C7C5202